MSKVRIYELAKKLNVKSKDIIEKLEQEGINVKNHMSCIDEEQSKVITRIFTLPDRQIVVDNKKVVNYHTKENNLEDKNNNIVKSKKIDYSVKTSEKAQTLKQVVTAKPASPMPNLLNNLAKKNKKSKKNKKQEKVVNMVDNSMDNNEEIKIIEVPTTTTIKLLADKIDVSATEIIKEMMKQGKLMTMNQEIDYEMATKIGELFNVIVEQEDERDLLEEIFGNFVEDETKMVERPPVVVVMGHVDHGKTSLLDAIRSTNVTTGEAGGITQHIGASAVTLNGKKITFLDTPGHEAFTAMRMRGAQVTDIAILVVAADDGVMPQTIEAINHAKAANVQIIVAVNKIDKPGANPDRVKQELAEYGLLVEEWGGETICVHVSALKHEGIDNLLEMILLVAEVADFKANPTGKARGTVIEAELDKGRGPVATVLVQRGTLKIGDPIVVGDTYGRIRAMNDHK